MRSPDDRSVPAEAKEKRALFLVFGAPGTDRDVLSKTLSGRYDLSASAESSDLDVRKRLPFDFDHSAATEEEGKTFVEVREMPSSKDRAFLPALVDALKRPASATFDRDGNDGAAGLLWTFRTNCLALRPDRVADALLDVLKRELSGDDPFSSEGAKALRAGRSGRLQGLFKRVASSYLLDQRNEMAAVCRLPYFSGAPSMLVFDSSFSPGPIREAREIFQKKGKSVREAISSLKRNSFDAEGFANDFFDEAFSLKFDSRGFESIFEFESFSARYLSPASVYPLASYVRKARPDARASKTALDVLTADYRKKAFSDGAIEEEFFEPDGDEGDDETAPKKGLKPRLNDVPVPRFVSRCWTSFLGCDDGGTVSLQDEAKKVDRLSKDAESYVLNWMADVCAWNELSKRGCKISLRDVSRENVK